MAVYKFKRPRPWRYINLRDHMLRPRPWRYINLRDHSLWFSCPRPTGPFHDFIFPPSSLSWVGNHATMFVEAARQRGSEAARQRGSEAARQRGCGAVRLRGCGAAGLRGYEVAWLRVGHHRFALDFIDVRRISLICY